MTAPVAPRATAEPAITGTARDGATLTATSGGWNGATGLAFAYRWLRCDAAGDLCVDLASAASAYYTAGAADVGATLRVRVTADANGGRTSSVSAPTPVVAPAAPRSSTRGSSAARRATGRRSRRPRAAGWGRRRSTWRGSGCAATRRAAPASQSPARPGRR